MATKKDPLILDSVYRLLDEVDREFSNARRRLAKAAAEIPVATKPASGGASPLPRVLPSSGKPSSWGSDVPVSRSEGVIREATIQAAANVIGTRTGRPQANVSDMLKEEIDRETKAGAPDFGAALEKAKVTVITAIALGSR